MTTNEIERLVSFNNLNGFVEVQDRRPKEPMTIWLLDFTGDMVEGYQSESIRDLAYMLKVWGKQKSRGLHYFGNRNVFGL